MLVGLKLMALKACILELEYVGDVGWIVGVGR